MLHFLQLVYHSIIILFIAWLLFQPVLAQDVLAQDVSGTVIQLPSTREEAFSFFLRILKFLPQAFISAIQETWSIFLQIIDFGGGLWDKYVWPQIKGLWQRILSLLGTEVQKRKPIIEQELEKEKQEVQREVKHQTEKAATGLWERLKELIKNNLD